ncbi:MAG: glycosyltransferase family 2 protein [Bdellovibrionales bacterium]|nr:glycosyltransferase family 2 protein [Bdellovibrionales bacterium]
MKLGSTQEKTFNLSLSVVVAAYNEEACLKDVLIEICEYLEANVSDWEIIIVDDGSLDQTYEIAKDLCKQESRIRCERLEVNSGMGAALKLGYKLAQKDWVTMLPADGQIKPREISKLLRTCEDADVVTTLYDNAAGGWFRKTISMGLRVLTVLIVGSRARTQGNYLVRRSILNLFSWVSNSFLLNLEIPIRIKKAGYRYKTAYISVSPRIAGESKAVTPGRIFKTFYDLFLLRWKMIKTTSTK